jgi:phytoene/squalene synthetase
MVEIPFLLRRPWLLARGLLADRDAPDLDRLDRIADPRRFVWAILPHAARTFSACIVLLPRRVAEAAAVAYLYCRTLDTYEDLVVDAGERDAALRRFAERFDCNRGAGTPTAAPAIGEHHGSDQRDAAHLLLVRRCDRIDAVYARLDPAVQGLIRRLVRDMAEGMRWSSSAFVRQGGVLRDEEQLAGYCRGVLGHPVLFASRLLRWHQTGDATLPAEVERQAMTVGEMIQLANVTRDIEKDLRRGVAYHPALRDDVAAEGVGSARASSAMGAGVNGQDDGGAGEIPTDTGLAERIRRVRAELLVMALKRAPAYRPLMEYLSPRRVSLARASGLLMLSFTDQYFRGCALRAGRQPWGPSRGSGRLIAAALPAVWSRRWAGKRLAGIERNFLRAAA